ncbi:MAG: hypothetical protein IJV64_01975 [Oscillospiraceae bacterium]|nr:hypothetical protein [Oscillospiraceae bacterium]
MPDYAELITWLRHEGERPGASLYLKQAADTIEKLIATLVTWPEYSTIQRVLGQIEGAAYGVQDERIRDALFVHLESLDYAVNKIAEKMLPPA